MKMRLFAAVSAPLFVLSLSLGACRVQQTEEGEMPDVEVEGGQMPEYDVDAADVDVRATEDTIVTPSVDVDVNQPGETPDN